MWRKIFIQNGNSFETIRQQESYTMFTSFYPGKSRAFLAITLLIMGCASTEKRAEISANSALYETSRIDPYEGFNRSMYSFNMKVDKYLFKPVAEGYKFITPDVVETGVSNFFNNLKGINVVLNDVLQGKFQQGASDAGRFLTNTTLGIGGVMDVASKLGLEHNVEDFGQTLAVWGVTESTYLVLPIMGPTTLRDGSALIVDRAANPGTYVPFTGVLEGINDRANAQGALNFIDEAALDPYVFTRESFLQYRRHLINDGRSDSSAYDSELDVAVDNADDLDAEASGDTPSTATETMAESEKAIPTSLQAVDKLTERNAAFDKMVRSFEETSLKIDRWSRKESGMNFSRSEKLGSSIQ
jgi:phospholipid-binding lipoprotein MlaA